MEELFEYKDYLHEYDNVQSELIIGEIDERLTPLVSVIMPIYNHPMYFEKSLLSVLGQKCNFPYEVIIIDNNHPDFQKENQQIVEQYWSNNVRYYVNSDNLTSIGSENKGIIYSRGKYVTFCHDDDLLYEDTLQILVDWSFSLKNEDSAIFGRVTIINENGDSISKNSEWDSCFLKTKTCYALKMSDFLTRNYSNGCGSLYNRNNLVSLGGFCKDYVPTPDYALNALYTVHYGGYSIRNTTLQYRVSPLSDTGKVYHSMIGINKKIRYSILHSSYVNFYPKIFVIISLKAFEYSLYAKWENQSLRITSFFYKALNRLWLSFIYWLRSRRTNTI